MCTPHPSPPEFCIQVSLSKEGNCDYLHFSALLGQWRKGVAGMGWRLWIFRTNYVKNENCHNFIMKRACFGFLFNFPTSLLYSLADTSQESQLLEEWLGACSLKELTLHTFHKSPSCQIPWEAAQQDHHSHLLPTASPKISTPFCTFMLDVKCPVWKCSSNLAFPPLSSLGKDWSANIFFTIGWGKPVTLTNCKKRLTLEVLLRTKHLSF